MKILDTLNDKDKGIAAKAIAKRFSIIVAFFATIGLAIILRAFLDMTGDRQKYWVEMGERFRAVHKVQHAQPALQDDSEKKQNK
ncbi:MAG: hypothetical protein ACI382_03770 [Alloprevotella sp.]